MAFQIEQAEPRYTREIAFDSVETQPNLPIEQPPMSETITTKDIKILWSRSDGLCAMPDCRRKLTYNASDGNLSVTLGQMCHIVGEKNAKNSPRGISKLPVESRNTYSNLILLCAHHHAEIDRNEKDWPVEILHKLKDEHELWVEETLGTKNLTPDELIYSTIIDQLDNVLKLNSWNWFIDHAVRNMVHEDFLLALDFIDERQLAINWPGKYKDLERATQQLLNAFSNYMHHFLKFSTLAERGQFLRTDVSYKTRGYSEDYDIITERNGLWMRKCFQLLCSYTYFLNEFAAKVRMHINPMFYVVKGNFRIIDDLGSSNGGEGYKMLPDIRRIILDIKIIEEEIAKFEEGYPGWKC